jgi:hypothetical protein
MAHELAEMLTEPYLNAWYDDSSGKDIGAICEGNYRIQFLPNGQW